MLKKKFLLVLITAMLMVGCVPSLHCLYDEKTLDFDPKLAGCWNEGPGDKDQKWCFKGDAEKKVYELTITEDKGKASRLTAHLVHLDGRRFLDLAPAEDERMEQFGGWYQVHLLKAHTFLRVHQTDPNLMISVMDPDKTKTLLAEKPELLKHEVVEDRVVLTASTDQLQAFFKDENNLKAVFGKPQAMKRLPAEQPMPQ
jgi:hypothetical protein